MSLALDPSIRSLDDCGCCDGLGRQTPLVVDNRPGLTAIAYRAGTHSAFKASMLARLSAADLRVLNELTTRAGSDFSIALLDAWAAIADIVSFYQERLANEGYLRTALERRSLVELANLVGYVPRPGVAATTHLAFEIDDTGLPGDVPVPPGTRVQSIPGPGELPQVFETIEAIAGRHEWNAMRPLLAQKHPAIAPSTASVTVRGVATGIGRGDSIMLLCGAGSANRVVKRVLAVHADTVAQTTRIDLAEDPPDAFPLIFIQLPLAIWQPAPKKLTTKTVLDVMQTSWKQADLKAYAKSQTWSLPKLATSIVIQTIALLKFLPAETGVFAFRQRASIFGHNAPKYDTLPATQRFTDYTTDAQGKLVPRTPPFPTSWEFRRLDDEPGASTRQIDLDRTYPSVVKGSWLVLEDPFNREIYKVEDNTELSRADYTLTGRVSRIKLNSSSGLSQFGLRNTSVLADSEKLELAELPVTDVVKGNRLVLDRVYLGLTEGRPVVVTGKRVDLHGVLDSEVVTIADIVFNAGLTELVFATSLANQYDRATVTVNANVALATHGETRAQALGSGDANRPFQEFVLPEAPLTYVPSKTATGASSTLELRVNELLWQETGFLYGHGRDDHVYITREDDEGRTHVTFGDGIAGARVPTGLENVRVTYRKGIGAEGLVHEGQLSLALNKPLGVRGVVNPVAAGDAADADGPEDLRRNAALPIHTLDRIVSLRDYEDFARAFTGVAKALATWTWNGHARGVFVTVAGVDGNVLEDGGLTHTNLVAAMRAAGDPSVPLRVESFVPAFFRLALKVSVDPAHEQDAVLLAVEAALRGAFSFDARAFGQPVAKSEVVAIAQGVAGVVAVDIDELHRTDAPVAELAAGRLHDVLVAQIPRHGTDLTVGAELLLLDPRPVKPGVMTP